MITNEDIPEADDIFDPEEFDNCVNIELALYRHDDGTEFVRVNKRLKDIDGRPIVIAADNPILDTSMYKVECADGYKTAITANAIANNFSSQFNQYGQRFVLFDDVIDSRIDVTQINEGGIFHPYGQLKQEMVERPPKNGKFSYNGMMGVLLGTTSKSPSRCN